MLGRHGESRDLNSSCFFQAKKSLSEDESEGSVSDSHCDVRHLSKRDGTLVTLTVKSVQSTGV